jgi:ACS family glucarate transporter-like MFS transporter
MSFSASTSVASRPTTKRLLVLAVLCSLALLTYLDRICIMRVQNDMARDLHFGSLTRADEQLLSDRGQESDAGARLKLSEDRARTRVGWVFSAFLWGYMLFEIPGGWLGDVWGPRFVITRIVVWWSLFTILTGSIDSMAGWITATPSPALIVGLMIATRFLFGLGEAGAYPNISRALGRWFPAEHRGAAQGVIWLSSRLGGALAPTIVGTLMVVTRDWRRAFWILGAIGGVWAVLFYFWYRDRPEDFAGVNDAECRLIRGNTVSTGSIYNDGQLPALRWLRLAGSANIWAVCLVSGAVSFSWYFYVTFLPQYLNDVFQVAFDESELMTGLPLLVGGVGCMVGGQLTDWLIRRTGARRWGRSGIGFVGMAGASLCALATTQMSSAWSVIATICVACVLQDLALPCLWSVAVDIGGPYAGTICGVMNSAGAIGGALSPLVVSRVAGMFQWNAVFLLFAAAYGLAAFAWLRIDATESVTGSAHNKLSNLPT